MAFLKYHFSLLKKNRYEKKANTVVTAIWYNGNSKITKHNDS